MLVIMFQRHTVQANGYGEGGFPFLNWSGVFSPLTETQFFSSLAEPEVFNFQGQNIFFHNFQG